MGPRHTVTLARIVLSALLIASGIAEEATSATRYVYNRQDFSTSSSTSTNNFGSSVASGDFNKDGLLDVALVPNGALNQVTILLGNADGTFTTKQTISGLSSPKSVVAADFSGDGKLDLAIAENGNGMVVVYLGAGDGTFTLKSTLVASGFPYYAVSADLTGDKKQDLAVLDQGGNVDLFVGNGDGTFTLKSSTPPGVNPTSMVAGDLNGDGKQDLAVVINNFGSAGTVAILLGNGDGTFTLSSTPSTGTNGPLAIAAADFTGDGKLDLVVTASSVNPPNLSILLNNGNGTFTLGSTLTEGIGLVAVATGDLNGDGKQDVAVVNQNGNSVITLLGAGNGTFTAAPGLIANSGAGNLSAGSIALGDFNRDGKLDAVVANTADSTMSVLLGNGDGSLISGVSTVNGGSGNAVAGAVADFNGDGKVDLAVANLQGGTVSILLSNGDGTFTLNSSPNSGGTFPNSVALGDFNGDGKTDLAVSNRGSNAIAVLLSNGDGSFQKQISTAAGSTPLAVASGDFNKDGKIDVAVANSGDGTISILLGNGDGTFTLKGSPITGGVPASIAIGDYNKDGKLDLAVADNLSSGLASVLLGNGDGTFQSHVDYAVGAFPDSIAAADFNKDGNLDLVIANVNSNSVSVLLGNGNGTFQAHVDFGAGVTPVSVVTGDFNGDGNLDVAVADSGGAASLLLGNGNGTFQADAAYGVAGVGFGFLTNAVVAADFNADGGLDLAAINGSCCADNDIVVLLNFPVVAFNPASFNFGKVQVGVTSTAQTLTTINPSGTSLKVTSIKISGTNAADFAQTNTCGTKVLPGAQCTTSLTFTPTAPGTRKATLTFTDSAKSSPQKISLTGTGLGPLAQLSPTSLTFATQLVGTTSAAQTITLTNTGNQAMSISSISASGDFAQTNTCPASLAAGANCAISVTFTPTASGTRSGTLSVADNAPGSPQTASLTGTGTVVSLSPTSLNFGNVTVGKRSPPQTITLTNTGSTTLTVNSVSITGTNAADYSQTNTCGTSVVGGGSCTITVTFKPSATGARTASVSVSDSGGGSPQTVGLTGTGI